MKDRLKPELTKQEYFAAKAMQGLLSNSSWTTKREFGDKTASENIAGTALQTASAILDRLFPVSRLSMQKVLDYEVRSHWLAPRIGFKWGQVLMGRYFAWKVRRKYNRYLVSLEERKRGLNAT